MATIQKTIESVGMKITVNHGEVDGKIVKSSKTYSDLKVDVTDEAFMASAKSIASMQEPIREKQAKVTTEDFVEVA